MAPSAVPPRAPLRVLEGGGQRRPAEALVQREAVIRCLVEVGAGLLLRHVSPERAAAVEAQVEKVLGLFDAVAARPQLRRTLERELRELEDLMAPTRARPPARPPGRRAG